MAFWFLPSHNLALFSRIITRQSIKSSLGNYFGEHRVFCPSHCYVPFTVSVAAAAETLQDIFAESLSVVC